MTTHKSRIIEEMQEAFADLKKSGVISKKQIAEFEALKQLEVKAFQPSAIKHLRAKNKLSQAVFAVVLNTSASTISRCATRMCWTAGTRWPSPMWPRASSAYSKGSSTAAWMSWRCPFTGP